MRGFLTVLFLVFALVVGSIHSPALAHDEGDHHVVTMSMADLHHEADAMDDHHAPHSQDRAGDALHHHHCPAGLSVAVPAVDALALRSKGLIHVSRVAILLSRVQAPPFEPPVA